MFPLFCSYMLCFKISLWKMPQIKFILIIHIIHISLLFCLVLVRCNSWHMQCFHPIPPEKKTILKSSFVCIVYIENDINFLFYKRQSVPKHYMVSIFERAKTLKNRQKLENQYTWLFEGPTHMLVLCPVLLPGSDRLLLALVKMTDEAVCPTTQSCFCSLWSPRF